MFLCSEKGTESPVANVWTLYGQEPHSAAGTSEWWRGETFNLLESD